MNRPPPMSSRATPRILALTAVITAGLAGCDDLPLVSNEAPEARITSPADGAGLVAGESTHFEGTATDSEDGTLTGSALAWTSGADGQIGTGGSFTRSDLSAGEHTVTLTATDSDGASGTASVDITVNATSDAQIASPSDGATFAEGDDVAFEGSATDPEDGALTGSALVWTSSTDGEIGTGESFTRSDLSGGTHTITLTATDPDGLSASTSLELTVEGDCAYGSTDSDGDGLPDCAETDTGVFVDSLDTGTDPANPDTDGDGIEDGDEVLGTDGGLDLPAMGVSPLRRDVLLEYDWFEDDNDCAMHSHRPTSTQISQVTEAFESAPVSNPDGSTGINFIHDYGQGGAFTGGNLIDDADGVLDGGVNDPEFGDHKADHFDANRHGYFHYVILPHRYDTDSSSSGQAEVPGDDLIVSLQCHVDVDLAVANTIVHEIGHNFGLLHGGDAFTNYKPNYNSVMNYKYQFAGTDDDCAEGGDGILDYSTGQLPSLDENDLDETAGICGPDTVPWDWNQDGDSTDVGVAADINRDGEGNGDGEMTVLEDYDDWANLYFLGIVDSADGSGAPVATRVVSCRNTPPDLRP